MEKIKYCPKCRTTHNLVDKKCDCGFEFVEVEVEDNNKSDNTTIINDPIPEFVWKLIAFFVPIAGYVLYFVFKQEWPRRAKISLKMAIIMTGVIVACSIIVVLIYIGIVNCDIIWSEATSKKYGC